MKKHTKKILSLFLGIKVFLSVMLTRVAAFTNPVLSENLGGNAEEAAEGTTFVNYFVNIWQAFITVGAVIVLVYFLWGAIEWITAGGDSSKITKARDRITQSLIGLLILVGSFVIIGFISNLFFGDEFSILNLQFTAPGE